MDSLWCHVREKILKLNNALQQKDKESVEENDIHRMGQLPRNFVLIFEVHGEKYNIMQVRGRNLFIFITNFITI